jgi:hypothetical protein
MRPTYLILRALACALLCFFATLAAYGEGVSMPVLKATLPASWDESWFGSPVVADLHGDGAEEIIAARGSVLYVWNAAGKPEWRAAAGKDGDTVEVHGSARQYAGPVVGALEPKGKVRIAISYENKVAVYDDSGRVLPGWPKTFPGPAGEIRSLAAADLDGDDTLEIVAVKSGAGPATMAWKPDGKDLAGWPQAAKDCAECNDYGGYNQNIGIADLDGDKRPEVVATYDASYIGVFQADGKSFAAGKDFQGPYASSVPFFHDLALAQAGSGPDGDDRDEFTYSPPSFADLDGDGKLDIILYSNHEKAGDTVALGNCLWAVHPDMSRVKGFEKPLCSDKPIFTGYYNNIVETQPTVAIANLSGDARPEIVTTSNDGTMRGYSNEGVELWKYRYDVDGEPWIQASEPVIGDLNNDGIPEIVFTTYSVDQGVSHLTILDNNGKMQRKAPLANRGAMAAPVLADVDGDHKLDIVISLKDAVGNGNGGVQIWTVASAGDAQPAWPMARGNAFRTGVGNVPSGPVALPRRGLRARKAANGPWYDALGIPVRGSLRAAPRLPLAPVR